MLANHHKFNQIQSDKIEELFEKFYYLSKKIAFTAKSTKMAIIAQSYSNIELDDFEIEIAFDNILEDIEYIIGESVELSTNSNYLLWNNRREYNEK